MNKKASIYNLSAVGVKILSGPLVYYLIAFKFEPFFLVAYFFILTINNMRTIFEGGVTNIVKRNYVLVSNNNIKSINTFSYIWFLFISILLFIISLFFGSLYIEYILNNFDIIIFPLILAVFASSLRISILYMDAYVDGYVSSVIYRKTLLISNLLSTLVLILSIQFNFALYSIFFSQLTQVLVIYFLLKKHMQSFEIYNKKHLIIFRNQFKKFKNLIQLTMKTWSIGYFFWNATFWITPIFFQDKYSANILFTYAIFKSIYDISASFIHSNIPIITKKIKNNLYLSIRIVLKKIFIISSLSYLVIITTLIIIINSNIFEKFSSRFLEYNDLIFLSLLFYLILLKTIIHNFIRCYQIEPFFYYVLYNAIVMIISPIISSYFGCSFFIPHLILLLPMIILTFLMLKNKTRDTYV